MFRPGETVCVSDSKFGYHSMPLEKALGDMVTLLSPNPDVAERRVHTDSLIFSAINPIQGFREDQNCYKFRNFMLELDGPSLRDQWNYIQQLGIPFSACIFSGNKSLHFLISVDQDIPSEKLWRMFAEWILKIATFADQQVKNPSRSIRIPGAYREPGKQQKLLAYNGQVKLRDLYAWLCQFPSSKPRPAEKRKVESVRDPEKVKDWVKKRLKFGLDPTKGRNIQWFAIACEFALSGYSLDDTINILEDYFVPDRTFKEKEWKTALHSGFKHIYGRK